MTKSATPAGPRPAEHVRDDEIGPAVAFGHIVQKLVRGDLLTAHGQLGVFIRNAIELGTARLVNELGCLKPRSVLPDQIDNRIVDRFRALTAAEDENTKVRRARYALAHVFDLLANRHGDPYDLFRL